MDDKWHMLSYAFGGSLQPILSTRWHEFKSQLKNDPVKQFPVFQGFQGVEVGETISKPRTQTATLSLGVTSHN